MMTRRAVFSMSSRRSPRCTALFERLRTGVFRSAPPSLCVRCATRARHSMGMPRWFAGMMTHRARCEELQRRFCSLRRAASFWAAVPSTDACSCEGSDDVWGYPADGATEYRPTCALVVPFGAVRCGASRGEIGGQPFPSTSSGERAGTRRGRTTRGRAWRDTAVPCARQGRTIGRRAVVRGLGSDRRASLTWRTRRAEPVRDSMRRATEGRAALSVPLSPTPEIAEFGAAQRTGASQFSGRRVHASRRCTTRLPPPS